MSSFIILATDRWRLGAPLRAIREFKSGHIGMALGHQRPTRWATKKEAQAVANVVDACDYSGRWLYTVLPDPGQPDQPDAPGQGPRQEPPRRSTKDAG